MIQWRVLLVLGLIVAPILDVLLNTLLTLLLPAASATEHASDVPALARRNAELLMQRHKL